MRPIVSLHRRRLPDDAAFTLTEMAASLVVAAMLVSGLGEVTRQFARTTVRIRATLEETRDMRLVQAEFAAIERAEPDGLGVASDSVVAVIGDGQVRFELSASGAERLLQWEREADGAFAPATRAIETPSDARFERTADGAVRLWTDVGRPPLLVAAPKRTVPFDCQFDVVVRDCR